MNRRQLSISLLAAACCPAVVRAQGAAWPERPVKIVLSQPPGSGPDNVARVLGDLLAKQWGQAVIVDNRPGGQNVIGAQAAARAPADGYTFYFGTTAALVTNAYLFKQLPYDPLKDFVPVAFVANSAFAVVVAQSSPIRSIDDLVAKSRARPGTLTLGNEGPRTFGGMIARLFNSRGKVEANLVSYASVTASTQDLMGGHVDAVVADVASTSQLVRQGRLRFLATTAPRRLADYDDVPALAELVPGLDMVGWFGVVAPVGTPAAATARFGRDVKALLGDRAVIDRIAAIGPVADGSMTTEQFGAFLRSEHLRWAQITREIGVLPE